MNKARPLFGSKFASWLPVLQVGVLTHLSIYNNRYRAYRAKFSLILFRSIIICSLLQEHSQREISHIYFTFYKSLEILEGNMYQWFFKLDSQTCFYLRKSQMFKTYPISRKFVWTNKWMTWRNPHASTSHKLIPSQLRSKGASCYCLVHKPTLYVSMIYKIPHQIFKTLLYYSITKVCPLKKCAVPQAADWLLFHLCQRWWRKSYVINDLSVNWFGHDKWIT